MDIDREVDEVVTLIDDLGENMEDRLVWIAFLDRIAAALDERRYRA